MTDDTRAELVALREELADRWIEADLTVEQFYGVLAGIEDGDSDSAEQIAADLASGAIARHGDW